MVVWPAERRAARAARWEIDLSGGTERAPRRARAGSTRVLSGMGFEGREFLFGQLAVNALREVAERDGADAQPLQGEERQAHRRARPTYYAVTAFVGGEVEGGLAGGAAEVGELRGEHRAVFQGWAGGEGGEGSLWGGISHPQFVFLLYLRGRVGHAVGQRAVVGQEEEAGGGGVEAADGDEAGEGRYQRFDGWAVAAGLVFHGSEVAGGFVQGEVGGGL